MFFIQSECRNCCLYVIRKSRHKQNLKNISKYGFSPDLGGKNGGVLSMCMQVILDSSFALPGSVPIWGGKKGEFRDWTTKTANITPVKAGGGGGGGYSQKNWVGMCGALPKTLFMTKICDIDRYPIYGLTKNAKPYL